MFTPVQGIDIYMHFKTYNYPMAFSTFMSKKELLNSKYTLLLFTYVYL